MPHLEAWTEARRAHAKTYSAALRDVPGIILPAEQADARHVYHVYCIRLAEGGAARRDAVRAALNAQGIGAGIHYPIPLHLQPALAGLGHSRGSYPQAEAAADSILSLPIYPELTGSQIEQVVDALQTALAAIPA